MTRSGAYLRPVREFGAMAALLLWPSLGALAACWVIAALYGIFGAGQAPF